MLALAACAPPAPANPADAPQPAADRTPRRAIRLYTTGLPACPFRSVGSVRGGNYDGLRQSAYQYGADAVIEIMREPAEPGARSMGGPYTGTAVVFTDPGCRR